MHAEMKNGTMHTCSACGLPRRFFVSGTDTGVGKTFVCALMMMNLEASYWKPIQSGKDPYADTQFIQQLTGLPPSSFFPERYALTQPLSPHAAARIDGINIDIDSFALPKLRSDREHLIVEGAGGVLVPLNDSQLLVDLIKHLALPVVIVARSTLGTINHTLLTIEALKSRSIPIAGVVMNGPANPRNKAAIEDYGQVRVLFQVPYLNEVSPAALLLHAQKLPVPFCRKVLPFVPACTAAHPDTHSSAHTDVRGRHYDHAR